MFNNIRILSIISAVLLIFLSVLPTFYLKNYLLKHMANPYLNSSEKITQLYTTEVWNRYSVVIDFISHQNSTEWSNYPQFLGFLRESKVYLDASNIVKIYLENKPLLFNSNQNVIVKDPVVKFTEMTALGSYSIVRANVVNSLKVEDRHFLLIQKNIVNNKVGAIIEFWIDIEDFYKKLNMMQVIFVFIAAIFIILVVILIIFASKKVEELLNKQEEASLELANAKAVAESESKAKSQFLANISHELRTPLNAIIGFSEIIESESMGALNNPQYKEFIKDIHASGVHLLSLINDILDFSKAEENKLKIDFEPVELVKSIKLCLRMIIPRAEAAKVQIVDEVPLEHIIILSDAKRLKQVILNLITNAIKFTPENGKVSIRLIKNMDNNSVSVEIKDTGVGIEAQDLARALSPFGQVENKLSKRFEGTGLGLPLTKKLTELMRGKFDIQSEPNLGTTVMLTFPFQSNDIEVPSEVKKPLESNAPPKPNIPLV